MDANIKVSIRCRPLSTKEVAKGCQCIVSMSEKNVRLNTGTDGAVKEFTFDQCYFTDSTQEQVYRDLGAPLLAQAVDGFNGTIFAYGQTGSGKTHSMMGSESDPGIVPRLNDDLWAVTSEKLKHLQKAGGGETKFMITVSFLEIYNESITDLLNPRDGSLKIRENPQMGIYVEGLCELIVRDSADIMRLIEQGNTVRRVAATNMNDQSSRSHSCFTIKIEMKTTTELAGGVTREQLVKAKLNLVDLAGSERAAKTGATGSTLKEGSNINMSLMALGNVINALSEGSSMKSGAKKHIPYRDSKLTRLLQESLGGNSLTVMLAAISPADYNLDETLGTLKYANRAKSIANAISRNEDSSDRMIRDLKVQIELLQQQLASAPHESNPELEQKLHEMEADQRNAWEEKERLSKALEEERQANLNSVVSTMMEKVKKQKVEHMKAIKRLSNEKSALTQQMKEGKDSNTNLKVRLDGSMKSYQRLQSEYDSKMTAMAALGEAGGDLSKDTIEVNKVAAQMAETLASIESDRASWLHTRDLVKKGKERLAQIDEEMQDERGELVATTGLLDQNDKLRAQIQAEEREKARERIEAEMTAARQQFDLERAGVRGSVEEELGAEMQSLRMQLAECQTKLAAEQTKTSDLTDKVSRFKEYADGLELKLADAEVGQETAQAEVARLLKVTAEVDDLHSQIDKLIGDSLAAQTAAATELAQALQMKKDLSVEFEDLKASHVKLAEDQKYEIFRVTMDAVAKERLVMEKKIEESKTLLGVAVKDILFLSQENSRLRESVGRAVLWEPTIRASAMTVAGTGTGVDQRRPFGNDNRY